MRERDIAISFKGARFPPEAILMGVRWSVAYPLSTRHVDELREECETTFVKAIEFERFRDHSTFAETEAIAQDLEKMRCWFAPIVERDWFAAPRRTEAEAWLDHCQRLLDTCEQDVDKSHRLPCQRTPSPRSAATDGRAPSP
jgi:hypothetical protein